MCSNMFCERVCQMNTWLYHAGRDHNTSRLYSIFISDRCMRINQIILRFCSFQNRVRTKNCRHPPEEGCECSDPDMLYDSMKQACVDPSECGCSTTMEAPNGDMIGIYLEVMYVKCIVFTTLTTSIVYVCIPCIL